MPVADDGTEKVAVKDPDESVVMVDDDVVSVVPLNVSAIVEEGAKSKPVTVTICPAGPPIGLALICGVTVKTADALTFLESVALTVCLPAIDTGTEKVAVKDPDELVVMADGDMASVVLSNVNVTADEFVKPEPVIMMVVPFVPEEGFNEIEGRTLNGAEPRLFDASIPASGYEPAGNPGTLKVAVNIPDEFVVICKGLVIILVPLKVSVTADELAKPEPVVVIVTALPVCTLPGFSEMEGVIVYTEEA